ncbi:MAG TPA: tripartite tricarboxylate transporter substrate binding protein [Xanthobacteraceae bacterium]|nr:tripartite tricarboxylate transporter substrate binding protein [Xanthobacteraceae bacterium]
MKQKMLTVLVVLIAHLPVLQSAQAFPDRPIRLVVPSTAGGPPDVVARLLSDKMAAILGQPVIVENRSAGAGGTIGSKSVATAEPDGYTLLMGSTSTLLIAPSIYKNVGYHAGTFAPVARVADSTEVLAVHPSVPANSVAELIALAKSRPDALNYGSAGIGTLPHLEGELLKARAQIEMNHIPYRGGGPALTGLLGGQVQVLFSTLTQMLPHMRDGRVRGLAVTSATRSKLAPELPTMVESGFDAFIMTSITAIVAPPGTPIDIRRRLNEAVAGALASEEVERSLSRMGGEARPASPEELASFLAAEQQRWARIIETTRVSVD